MGQNDCKNTLLPQKFVLVRMAISVHFLSTGICKLDIITTPNILQ